MLMSGLFLALYLWNYIAKIVHLDLGPELPLYTAIAAAICFLIAFIFYLWEVSNSFAISLTCNYILLAVVTLAIVQTGFLASPFLVFWILLSIFAPVFGWFGVAPMLFIGSGYVIWTVLTYTITLPHIGILIFISVVPTILGWLAWQRRPEASGGGEVTKSRLYHELTSKLTSISGQSEVVIAAITNGVISVDDKGTITLINPAATRMIGWGKEDAIGLDYRSVFKLNDARDQQIADDQNPLQQALTIGKEIMNDKLFLVTADSAKRVQVSITASPIPGGVIVVFRDITKERAEERQQAEFISTASHEMRTPVASIEGYLGLALNPATAQIDDRARDYIGKAHESAEHLGRLFQDLLDVSKADDGRLQNNPRVIDVVPFAHDIILGLLPKAKEKSLFINFKPNPDFEDADKQQSFGTSLNHDDSRVITPAFYVNVDSDHLREVVGNLVENAIKYTPHGSVEIDVTGNDTHVIISIADSGIGIPSEDMPHLFQKFYRVDNSDTREIGGTGLGLYLCRRLTETMGGKIWVESEYKKGSTFYLQLPRVDSVEAQNLIEQAEPLPETAATPVTPQPVAVATPTPIQQVPIAVPTQSIQPAPQIPTQPQVATPVAPVQAPVGQPYVQAPQTPSSYQTPVEPQPAQAALIVQQPVAQPQTTPTSVPPNQNPLM